MWNKLRLMRLRGGPMRSLLSIVILTMFVTGCAGTISNTRYICPSLKKYSPEFQDKVAAEFPRVGANTKQLVSDYGQLRDSCRALGTK